MLDPDILGTVADWVGGIGTIGALIYATKQIKIDKNKNDFDIMYGKIEILLNQLESIPIKPTSDYYINSVLEKGIENIPNGEIQQFYDYIGKVTKDFNDENPKQGDYLRTLNLMIVEITKCRFTQKISEEDIDFFIELIRLKIGKDEFDQILWNALFSPYSIKLNNNLQGLGMFSEKSKNEFLHNFESFSIYPSIKSELKSKLDSFDRK